MTDRSDTPLDALHLTDLDPQDLIAPNFRVYELSRCVVAERLDIDNRLPDDETLRAAVYIARAVMQPIRTEFGRFSPINVYRCQALERLMKRRPPDWISLSPHTRGAACDLRIPGRGTLELAQWVREHLPDCDEIRCERCDPEQGPSSGWVHIEQRGIRTPAVQGPRLQSEIRDRRRGRWVLVPGLTDRLPAPGEPAATAAPDPSPARTGRTRAASGRRRAADDSEPTPAKSE